MTTTAALEELAGRAAAAEAAFEWARTTELCRELFRTAVEAGAVDSMLEALMGEARAQSHDTATEEAEELAWLAHEIARRTGRPAQAASSLNLVATILLRRYDLTGASVLFDRAVDCARDLGDDELIAKACLNLGVIQTMLGNLREARARYLESVSAGIRSGVPAHAMRAYANLGIVCNDMGDWLEAQLHLDRGIEIAERLGDLRLQTVLRTNRVEPLMHLDEMDAARAEADLAERLARRVDHVSSLADVARFRGMIALAEGRPDAADEALQKALALTEENGLELSRAEVLEQIGLLRHRQAREEEALETLERAFEGFFALGAKRDVARIAPLLAEWRAAARQPVRIGAAEGRARSGPESPGMLSPGRPERRKRP